MRRVWPHHLNGYLLAVVAAGLGLTMQSHASDGPFLPDDALVACRAILPQCFTRQGWADLCSHEPDVMASHPESCKLALQTEQTARTD